MAGDLDLVVFLEFEVQLIALKLNPRRHNTHE
jgi:hypothetical protein